MRFWQPVLFVFFFILFLFRGIAVQDPDFGWHIQAGTYILQHGVAYTDPFSYSMPSYPFVDHEWLTNVLWSRIFNLFGIVPLLILSSGLAAGCLLLLYFVSEKKWTVMPLFIIGVTFFDFVGVRTQVITWFFLALLLCILFQKKLWDKWRFFLPILFLLWANLHGGYGIGLGVLGIVLGGRVLEERKKIKGTLLVLLLCAGATLINPYGIRLWWEFFMQLTDSQLRWSITEWYPAFYFTNIATWGYLILSVMLVLRYWKKYSWTELVLYFFLLFEGMSSMRNIPIWILVSFFMTMKGFSLMYQEAAKHPDGSRRFRFAYTIYCIILVIIFLLQTGMFFYGVSVLKESPTQYPEGAVAYLHKHLPQQQIFSSYDWGGYLIWKFPERKVFIDGRMPSWRWHADIKGESNYAFDEYKSVMTGQTQFAVFATKYHITTMLVPKADILKPPDKFLGFTINKSNFLQKFFFSLNSFYLVVGEVRQMGWKEVYSDDTTVIYQKPVNP
ncbi:MAG TPA: hypothetical protein VND99_03970 [Candidatus Acidoferrales bacterium]|nr:hypothetical protein [Candidatus Acidoferrales bacterium]